jgi:hypothetical protein
VSTYAGKVLFARYSGLSLRTTNKILLEIVLCRIALSRQKNPVTKRLNIHLYISDIVIHMYKKLVNKARPSSSLFSG